MPVITLTTDFGEVDYYSGAVKAAILSVNPQQTIVDISHKIEQFDLAHGAFVARSVFRDFPEGSIHIVAVDSHGNHGNAYLGVSLNQHYFLLTDHGILGLISDDIPDLVVRLNQDKDHSIFPAKEIMAPAAAQLANGTALEQLGTPTDDYKRMIGRHLRANKQQILGHVVRVNHYGNLISNISREVFCELSKGKRYQIIIGRESFRRIHDTINETGSGDCFLIFNSLGLLEIGINKGNASELLGLRFDSPVKIILEE